MSGDLQEHNRSYGMLNPTMKELVDAQLDITAVDGVELLTDKARGVIWVNVDGVCLLRICRIGEITVKDVRDYARQS
jgi:hypothetical protein